VGKTNKEGLYWLQKIKNSIAIKIEISYRKFLSSK